MLTITVSSEVHVKNALPVTNVECSELHFINLCALFAIIKVISNNISFTNN